ncbi:uncharacterized protein LOC135499900, partial [Lineus longissimus]|uniref:uncharacterized protein LOC135499900 n=1 Tax=Lineus longissimus TaxID=88925 RepID=UPI00315DDE39
MYSETELSVQVVKEHVSEPLFLYLSFQAVRENTSLWEGETRGLAFVNGPGVKKGG